MSAPFIVLEGIDGTGKSTQAAALGEALRQKGRKVHLTAEPTDGFVGDLIRRDVKPWTDPTLAMLLFMADRINHSDRMSNMLIEGYTVVCDRYVLSTMVYQIKIRTDIHAALRHKIVAQLLCRLIRPSLTILLDLPPKKAMERIGERKQSMPEFEKMETLADARHAYFNLKGHRWSRVRVIDASNTIEEVHNQIMDLPEIKGLRK